jgi:hypothetical protein
MADSQKMGRGVVSGGQRIDDHSFWAGGASKGSPFPDGNKVKTYSSAEGAGSLSPYEDTTEAIKKQQDMGISKAKAYKQKEHYKN